MVIIEINYPEKDLIRDKQAYEDLKAIPGDADLVFLDIIQKEYKLTHQQTLIYAWLAVNGKIVKK